MDVNEVKKTLDNYNELQVRAKAILEAGGIRFGNVDSITFVNDDNVSINYWVMYHNEVCHEDECVPIKMFADGADLYVEWEKLRDLREKNRKRAEANAKRAAKRAEKAEVRAKIKTYLAELNKVKEKYPDIYATYSKIIG